MIIKKRYMDKESYIKAEEEIRRTLNGIKYIMDESTNEELIYTKEEKIKILELIYILFKNETVYDKEYITKNSAQTQMV